MNGKHAAVANRADDLVSRVHIHEKALQPLGGYRRRTAGTDNAGAGLLDAPLTGIGAEDVDGIVQAGGLQVFDEADGDGINLIARRASGNPHADWLARLPFPHNRGEDALFQGLEDGRVAKELGDTDEKVLGERPDLDGILLQDPKVVIGDRK